MAWIGCIAVTGPNSLAKSEIKYLAYANKQKKQTIFP